MHEMDAKTARTLRYVLVAAVVVAAFLSSYSFALARSGSTRAAAPVNAQAAAPAGAATDSAACACCGGGPATTVAGEAAIDGDVQRIAIDTSTGQWSPNEITLKAGVPAVLTFAEGQGCLAQVVFPEFGITKDLTSGGATVELPALEAGEYTFACGMDMVFGKLVVR